MDQQILKDANRQERLQVLKDSAEKMESLTYPKVLTSDELSHLKSEYTKEAITLAKHDEGKKQFMENYKSEVKPLKLRLSAIMTQIRNKVEEVTEDVFLIADQEENMMGYYNAEGILINSRPLLPDERQFRIIDTTIKKAN